MKSGMSARLLVLTILFPSVAFAEVNLTPEVEQQIRDALSVQGYEVGKIKIEDELYEAYAKKDGSKYEIFLNEKLEVVKTKDD